MVALVRASRPRLATFCIPPQEAAARMAITETTINSSTRLVPRRKDEG